MQIRLEEPKDYNEVENLTREAFWNVYTMGCSEHLIAHNIRKAKNFMPALDFVAVEDGVIVGNILFTHSSIICAGGRAIKTATFGPFSVLPARQGCGIGRALVEHAKKAAQAMGIPAFIIYGDPDYYCRLGFKHAKDFNISDGEGRYPKAHLVLEVTKGALNGVSGKFEQDSSPFITKPEDVDNFDKGFAPKKKEETESQRKFIKTASEFL